MGWWQRVSFSLLALSGIGFAAHLYNTSDAFPRSRSPSGAIVGLDREEFSPGDDDSAAAFYWKSVLASEPHPTDEGQAWLSLVPANGGSPVIWNVTSDEIKVAAAPSSSENSGRVDFVGTFHGGLAPASVRYETGGSEAAPDAGKAPSATSSSWGYLNTDGQWVIPPHYKEAGPFVGDIAVVATPGNQLKLIDRKGTELATLPEPSRHAYRQAGIAGIKLARLGRWVWIDHHPWYSVTAEGVGEGEATQIFDGAKFVSLPGVVPIPSIDGGLWLLHTSTGPRLWKPDSGFVEVASNITPRRPLSANLFLADSRTRDSAALYSIDGRLIADPAPIFKALSPTRFIACESGASSSLLDGSSPARYWRPDILGQECGILDEKGQWWALPKYQMIDVWSEHEVRLQSESHACMVDLQSANAHDCMRQPNASQPVPLVESGQVPRLYGYQNRDGQIVLPYQFGSAYPFTGQIAKVSDQNGFPGLIDSAGHWLTSHPTGDVLPDAHVRAAIAQQPYRYRRQSGTGLIDRSGNWAVPPVFAAISRYADGSLLACGYTLGGGAANCKHLDVHGHLLPPTSDRLVADNGTLPESGHQSEGAREAELVTTEDIIVSSQPVAVALNGRWGFRDSEGNWVIKPQFDGAEDFSDGIAFAGIRDNSRNGDGKRIIWGLIDLSGNWIFKPKFESVTPFDGNIAVVKQSDLWGLIDRKGNWMGKPEFESIHPFVGDVAVAQQNDRLGLIDRKGNWLAKPMFSAISDFTDNVAIATMPGGAQCQLSISGQCIGEEGVEIVARANDIYMVVRTTGGKEQLYGYLSSDGKWAIQPTFYRASSFYHDFAVAQAMLPALSEALGLRAITTAIDYLPSANMYAVKAEKPGATDANAGRYALIDESGRWLVPRESSLFSFFGIH